MAYHVKEEKERLFMTKAFKWPGFIFDFSNSDFISLDL